jgi:hypothetical protein
MILAGVIALSSALSTSADVGTETLSPVPVRPVSDERGRSGAERTIESTLGAAEMLGTGALGIFMGRS